jgi:poly [ADP-ribose] polymerase
MGKIVEETMLVMVDTKNNNNKFYHVTLGEDNTVTKRWGRVGADGASSTEKTGRTGYERAIASKEKKGYKVSPVTSVGVTVKSKANHLEEVAKNFLAKDPNDTTITNLITRLVASNQHQIMEQSGGLIKVDDDGTVKTALGVVDLSAINEARSLLSKLQTNTRNQASLLEDYLTIIPQNIGYRRGWETEFLKAENFSKQTDFLKQLEDSVQWRNTTKKASDDSDSFDINQHADLFRMRLDKLPDGSREFDRINKLFKDTKNDMHSSRNLKLLNVFMVEDVKGAEAYAAAEKTYGNVKELWHGTKASNLLSILTKGLFVPNAGSGIPVTGRMFGNAVYFSDQSTKSLNYANGYWGGSRTNNNCFMLLNDVVMGHEFRPRTWDSGSLHKAHKGVGLSGKPYQSINVRGGTCGVRNNEMMVWNVDQIAIKYVCEFGA